MADVPQIPGSSGPLASALGSMQIGNAAGGDKPPTPQPTNPQKQSGQSGFEWRSDIGLFGIPLVHVAFGRDAKGRVRVAKGVIAIGQFGVGVVTIAQFGFALLAGVGQFMVGTAALAQFAFGWYLGIGQFATGYMAIGQFVLGYYGWAQLGFAQHLWGLERTDPQAVLFFKDLASIFGARPRP